jgi:hypothetical protein
LLDAVERAIGPLHVDPAERNQEET